MDAVSGRHGLDIGQSLGDTAADGSSPRKLWFLTTRPNSERKGGTAMSYLSASKLTFSPKWGEMTDDEQTAEQVAAYEIVSKFGGEIKAQYVLWSDNCLLSVVDYPDEQSAFKSELAIGRRGAFIIQAQRALPLEDVLGWQDEVRTVAGK
jgi:uncharacterized protein with GYD domain